MESLWFKSNVSVGQVDKVKRVLSYLSFPICIAWSQLREEPHLTPRERLDGPVGMSMGACLWEQEGPTHYGCHPL